MRRIVDQIKSQQWFFGVRAEASLFMYSAKYWNREELHKKEEYESDFVETMLFPKLSDYPVRVFNLEKAKQFHNESKNRVLENPELLADYIEKESAIWNQIEFLSEKMRDIIKWEKSNVLNLKDDFGKAKEIFKELLRLYGEVGNLFFINFSLGKELTANQNSINNRVSDILSKHDIWRNSVIFKEEKLGEAFYYFMRVLGQEKNINADPLEIIKYISAQEIADYLNGNKNLLIENLVEKRKKEGYLFAYLKNSEFRKVIDDTEIIKEISEHLLSAESEKKTNEEELSGQVAYKSCNKIQGEIILIKDKNELKKASSENLKGKILVAIQTTPHFIPYLKEIKAIITDEGGITCHAAIVSRELKIPCIIGTKIATQVLKDGNIVEVDANEGGL